MDRKPGCHYTQEIRQRHLEDLARMIAGLDVALYQFENPSVRADIPVKHIIIARNIVADLEKEQQESSRCHVRF